MSKKVLEASGKARGRRAETTTLIFQKGQLRGKGNGTLSLLKKTGNIFDIKNCDFIISQTFTFSFPRLIAIFTGNIFGIGDDVGDSDSFVIIENFDFVSYLRVFEAGLKLNPSFQELNKLNY